MIKVFCDRCGKEFGLSEEMFDVKISRKGMASSWKYMEHVCKTCVNRMIEPLPEMMPPYPVESEK